MRRNHRVGKFLIEGLARVPAGNQIVVQLDLTLDGTLKVSAREKSTGLVKQITIENAMAQYALEERDAAQERLNRMWSSPDQGEGDGEGEELLDEDGERIDAPYLSPGPAEGQRESVQARALLEKAERLRDHAAAADQTELDRLCENIRIALTDRAWGDLTVASNELTDVLFYLEDA